MTLNLKNIRYIIDMDGFYITYPHKHFQCREMAILDVKLSNKNDAFIDHYLFRPSYRFNYLSPKDKKTVRYCETHVHGIPYFDVTEELKCAYKQENIIPVLNWYIRNLCKDEVIAYKGGSTEKEFLKMLTTNDRIFNIEEYKCPKYNDLVNVINLNKRYVCNNHIFAKNNHKILHCS